MRRINKPMPEMPHRRGRLFWRRAGAILAVPLFTALVFAAEILYALYGFGETTPFTNPSRGPVTTGAGPPLKLVMLGDSTAAGQGAPYESGIARGAAGYLARHHRVTLINLGISGARLADVLRLEVPQAVRLRPDIVLISAGANDATHFTARSALLEASEAILDTLKTGRPGIRIVVLGSPDLGSSPRFPQPLRWFAGTQTRRVNSAWMQAVKGRGAIWAPVVTVGPQFAADPSLSSADRFHPDARGYAVWMPVVRRGLDEALRKAPIRRVSSQRL